MMIGDIKIEPQACPHCGDTVPVGDFTRHVLDGDCILVAEGRDSA